MTQGKDGNEKMSSKDETYTQPVRHDITMLSDDDLFLFNEGSHFKLYEKLGAHLVTVDGVGGTYFAVWAPNAKQVCITGEFNAWAKSSHHCAQKRNQASGKVSSLISERVRSTNTTSSPATAATG